jgi:PAS domain-containing protein
MAIVSLCLTRNTSTTYLPFIEPPTQPDSISYEEKGMAAHLPVQGQDSSFDRETARLQLLAETVFALAEVGLDYRAALELVVRRTAELIGDVCVVRLLSEDGQWLLPGPYFHPDPDASTLIGQYLAADPYPADMGSAGHVLRRGKSVLTPVITVEQMRTQVHKELWSYLERYGIHSLLVAPLMAGSRFIGTLTVARNTPGREYTVEDGAFLEKIGARAGLTIENARLYERAQRLLAEKEEALALLDALLANAPIGIGFMDNQLRFSRVNPTLPRMNGLTVEDYVGRTLAEVRPTIANEVEPLLKQVLTGENSSSTWRYRRQLFPTGSVPGLAVSILFALRVERFWALGSL